MQSQRHTEILPFAHPPKPPALPKNPPAAPPLILADPRVERPAAAPRRQTGRSHVLLATIVVCVAGTAMALRGARALRIPLGVDEAESSINAFSILEHGYPVDHHLGIPIYENMLVRPWPSHPEYAFKDISYSDRGVGVYHGWLPLYLIASSFELFHIPAPRLVPGWHVDAGVTSFRWRTIAARAPSLLVSAVFLLLMFVAAWRLAGIDAALTVLVLAGLSNSVVVASLSARYYALSLALGAASWVTLASVLRTGGWREYVRHAIVLILLFYTLISSFLIVIVLTTAALVLYRRTWTAGLRWVSTLLLVAMATIPWVLGTGFLHHLRYVPSGLSLLRFPDDLITYAADRAPYLMVFAACFAWLLWAWSKRASSSRVAEIWRAHGQAYVLLSIWLMLAVAAWFLLMPAASVFPQRLSLSVFVPGFLLLGLFVSDSTRWLCRPASVVAAPLLAIGILAANGVLRLPPSGAYFQQLADTFEELNRLDLPPNTKVYASPASHFVLTFYGDKPIQSIAPVRPLFLSQYAGPVVYIEQQSDWEFSAPERVDLRRHAAATNAVISAADVQRWEQALRTRLARERVASTGVQVVPPLDPLPPFAEEAMAEVRTHAWQRAEQERQRYERIPFSHGFDVRTASDEWQVFFYRMIGPPNHEDTSGVHLAPRLHDATAHFVPGARRVIYYSPPRTPSDVSPRFAGSGSEEGSTIRMASMHRP